MSENQVSKQTEPKYSYVIKSFCGDASFIGYNDPVEKAMDDASIQANGYLESLYAECSENHENFKIVSTVTHALATGDYFNYLITLTIEFTDKREKE